MTTPQDFPEVLFMLPFDDVQIVDFIDSSVTGYISDGDTIIKKIILISQSYTISKLHPNFKLLKTLEKQNIHFSNSELDQTKDITSTTLTPGTFKFLFTDNKVFSCNDSYYLGK